MSERGRSRRLVDLVLATLALAAGFVAGRTFPERLPTPGESMPLPDQQRTRTAALRTTRPGSPAAGGFFSGWPSASPDALVAEHIEFQYADLSHQTETALVGMWLFLATEALFFGSLFFLYAIYRGTHGAAVADASRHAELAIGTVNTVILLSSSGVFVFGLGRIQAGRPKALFRACIVTFCLGLAFLLLKAWEWKLDFNEHLFPGPNFEIHGPDNGPAQLFWSFYFIATGLHGLHMIVGLVLVSWIAWRTRQGRYTAAYHTPVEVVGLYWSFVDMIWLMLYPAIYLVARP